MSTDRIKELIVKYDNAHSEEERGRVAAELFCLNHAISPAEVKEIILAEADELGMRDLDIAAIAWCDEQLAARS